MAKFDIFKKEWLEVVFENRNKMYGAYRLRLESPKTTVVAFFGGIGLFGVLLGSTLLLNELQMAAANAPEVISCNFDIPLKTTYIPAVKPKQEDVVVFEKPIVKEKAEVVVTKSNTVKHTTLVVVDDNLVRQEVATVTDLLNADPGKFTTSGATTGVIDVGEGVLGVVPAVGSDTDETEEVFNQLFYHVQEKATPFGGMTAFTTTFISRFRAPELDANVKELKIMVQFIVEKNGALTDVRVLRDPGYGVGKEALRVLREMPKWQPAKQNGKAVRSQFTLPIVVKLH